MYYASVLLLYLQLKTHYNMHRTVAKTRTSQHSRQEHTTHTNQTYSTPAVLALHQRIKK